MQSANRHKTHSRIRKSIWMPIALLIYFGIMTFFFGNDHIASGHTLRLIITCLIELGIIIVLYFFLRKKEKLEERRSRLSEENRKIK